MKSRTILIVKMAMAFLLAACASINFFFEAPRLVVMAYWLIVYCYWVFSCITDARRFTKIKEDGDSK